MQTYDSLVITLTHTLPKGKISLHNKVHTLHPKIQNFETVQTQSRAELKSSSYQSWSVWSSA